MEVKIVISINGKEQTLTESEARELHATLDRVFAKPNRSPVIAPAIPSWPDLVPGWRPGDVWCGDQVPITTTSDGI